MYLLPNFLMGLKAQRHLYRLQLQQQLAWRAAAAFALGHALCGLVVSVVTDLASRAAFVGELRRTGTAAGQGQGEEDSSGNGSNGASAYGQEMEKGKALCVIRRVQE